MGTFDPTTAQNTLPFISAFGSVVVKPNGDRVQGILREEFRLDDPALRLTDTSGPVVEIPTIDAAGIMQRNRITVAGSVYTVDNVDTGVTGWTIVSLSKA